MDTVQTRTTFRVDCLLSSVIEFGKLVSSVFNGLLKECLVFYLFKQYLKRVTQLAVSASLPCGPLHIKSNIFTCLYIHTHINNNS